MILIRGTCDIDGPQSILGGSESAYSAAERASLSLPSPERRPVFSTGSLAPRGPLDSGPEFCDRKRSVCLSCVALAWTVSRILSALGQVGLIHTFERDDSL